MTKARDIMHRGAECISPDETVLDASRKMRDLNVGSLPICDADRALVGIVTDRDIVVKCLAEGLDPALCLMDEIAYGLPISVSSDADEDEVLRQMEGHAIRRLPVMEDNQLVGIISEADVARNLPDKKVAHFVEAICA